MISFRLFCPILLFSILVIPCPGQLVHVDDFGSRRVEEIRFEKNWRTKDPVLLAELEFSSEQEIGSTELENSLRKIWNLGNFAEVSHRWDSLPGRGYILYISARDAITISPILSGWTNRGSGALKLGLEDRNLLGRNIRFEGRLQLGEPMVGSLRLTIPRQLLYRNMTVSVALLEERMRLPEWSPVPGTGSTNMQLNLRTRKALLRLGNPFHEDFIYRFSPDFQLSYIQTSCWQHVLTSQESFTFASADSLLKANWLEIRFLEQVGTLTRKLHQTEGFQFLVEMAAGRVLAPPSDQAWELVTGKPLAAAYLSLDGSAEWHEILAPRWQSSLRFDLHLSNSRCPAQWNIYDGSRVTGILPGQLASPVNGHGYAGIHYTWFSHPWLTLEQNLFALYAFALPGFDANSGTRHHYALGTGLEFSVPMYPKAGLRISVFYSGSGMPWYFLEL